MPAPTRVDWTSGSNAGAATLTLSNPAGATTGDRLYAFISHTGTAATITDLQGWTLVLTLTFNARKLEILERPYAGTYPALTLSTGEGMLWATVAVRATSGYDLGATQLGTTWRRVDNGGLIATTQAPSMTAPADALALAYFSETSTGAETEAQTTLSGTGWAKWFWSKATAGDANPVNYVAYATPAAGPTGTATTTWPNNSNNGAGVQLVIPQTSNTSVSVGTAASALAPMSQSAAGAVVVPAFTGAAASGLPVLGSAAAGATTVPAFSGTGSSTLPGLSQVAAGATSAPVFAGLAASALPGLVSSGSGGSQTPVSGGVGSSTLPSLVSDGAGVTGPPPGRTGDIAQMLPGMVSDASGVVAAPPGRTGAAVSSLPVFVAEAVGVVADDVDRPPFPDTLTLSGTTAAPLTLEGAVEVLTLEAR